MSKLGAPGVGLSTLGNYALVAGQALRTLILARLMGPASFGILNAANVAASFTPQSDLGCGRIGEQHASHARGLGDLEATRRWLIDAAGARMAPALVVAGVLFVLAALTALFGDSTTMAVILAFVAISAPLQSAWWAVMGWRRVHGEFRAVAHGQLGQVAIWLTVVPLVAWQFGLHGAFVAMAASFIPPVLITGRGLPLGLLLRPRWGPFRHLVRDGLPVWFIFATTFLFTNVDQFLAGILGGPEWLGYLSIATLTASALLAFSDGAAAAAHPRTLEHFAAHGRLGVDTPSITRVMHVTQAAFAALVPLSWLGMGVVTILFLHQYAASLPLVALLGAAASLVGTTTASNSTLLAVGLHRRVPLLFLLASAVRLGVALGVSRFGAGLTSIGIGAAAAALLFALTYLFLVTLALGLRGRAALGFVVDQVLGSALLVAGAGVASWAWLAAGTTGFLVASAGVLVVVCAVQAVAWFGWRRSPAMSNAAA
ncbi:MAG: oligosaccharide flippase family protein [Propionibacteriaceae bacterium]|nr:oligosaccharide flippase family protein [Propionibacteriaceae bacterium]